MKKLILFLALLAWTVSTLGAQERTITGQVIFADDNEPIIGATILVPGTQIGTSTDLDGNFTLRVPPSAREVVVSYIGMATRQIPITDRMEIVLENSDHKIDEVVVTALGMKRDRKGLGYAAQDLKGSDLNKAGTTGLSDALQGKLSGVEIVPSSGMPGASSQVVIRGARSFTGNNTPLYVVDGMPIQSTPDFSTGQSVSGTDIADRSIDIDPNDIESINVLKGQAAAALYGIRASNGVVVITTKSGRGLSIGRPHVTFTTNLSAETLSRRPQVQRQWAQGYYSDSQQVLRFDPTSSMSWGPRIGSLPDDPTYGGNVANEFNQFDASSTQGLYYVPQLAQAGENPWVAPAVYDNIDDFFHTGVTFNTSLNISQRFEKGNYSFGIGTAQQDGVIPSTGLTRYSVRGMAEVNLTEQWKTGFSANFVRNNIDKAPTANSGVLAAVYGAPPSYDLKGIPSALPEDPYTQISYRSLTFNNPYWATRHNSFNENTHRFFGNTFVEFTPKINWSSDKKLSARWQIGVDAYTSRYKNIYEYGTQGQTGSIESNSVTNVIFNSLFTVNYEMNITDDWHLMAMAGNEVNQENKGIYEHYGQGFNFGGNPTIQNTSIQSSSTTITRARTVGFFGNATLSWRNQLYLNVTGREDVVSTMPRGNRAFFYPSVSASYVLTELEPLRGNPILTFAKVRGSFAQVGQAGRYYNNYYVRPTYTGGFWTNPPVVYPLNGITAYVPYAELYDPDLTPQNTNSFEAGFDVRMFHNRLAASYTFSRQNIKNQIFPVPLAGSTGAAQYLTNGGKIHTDAHEIDLNGQLYSSPDITWDLGVNFTIIRNRVDELAPGVTNIFLGGFVTPQVRAGVGDYYPVIYGTAFKRDSQGRILVDEDPNSATYGMPMASGNPQVIGQCAPDFTMGINTSFRYRRLSVSATFSWRHGGDMYSGTNGLMDLYGVSKKTEDRTTPFVYPGYKSDGTPNDIVRGGADDAGAYETLYADVLGNIDEAYIYDASFFKMRDLTVKYQFPRVGIFDISIFAFARNVLLWAKMPNLDPESSQGNNNMSGTFERFSLPQTSSYGGGLTVTF